MVIDVLVFLLTIILYLLGGQTGVGKWVRRFLVPLGIVFRNPKSALPAALLSVALSIGYGENSALMKILKKEWLVRLFYAIIVYLPFGIIHLLSSQQPQNAIPGITALIIAYQLRLSGVAITDKIDLLWEDVARGAAIAINILIINSC